METLTPTPENEMPDIPESLKRNPIEVIDEPAIEVERAFVSLEVPGGIEVTDTPAKE